MTQWAGFPQVQDLGPFEFSVTAGDPSGCWIIDKFSFQAGRRELVRLDLTGTISDPLGASGLDLTFRAHGNDLKKLGTLLGSKVPAGGPFDISGRLRDKGKKPITSPLWMPQSTRTK